VISSRELSGCTSTTRCAPRARGASVQKLPELLQRGGRAPDAWLLGIDAIVRGGGPRYRVPSVDPDQLAELAASPDAADDARIGAAAAVVRADPSRRPRIRVVAEACANSSLREALLAVAEAEDDAAFALALGRAESKTRRVE
jgi:hypothetical protein